MSTKLSTEGVCIVDKIGYTISNEKKVSFRGKKAMITSSYQQCPQSYPQHEWDRKRQEAIRKVMNRGMNGKKEKVRQKASTESYQQYPQVCPQLYTEG